MSSSNQKFIADWEKSNANGPLKYILRIGLFSGVLMFLFMSAIELSGSTFSDAFLSQKSVTRLLVYLVAGLCVGVATWAINQYFYKQKIASDK